MDRKAIKLRLHPKAEEAQILDSQSKKCNWLYNHLLSKANKLREGYKSDPKEEIAQVLYTKRGLRNLVPTIKKENSFLKEVYAAPLKNTALRLTSSIQDYQKSRKGKRQGKQTNWPKYRSWKVNWFSLLYDEPYVGYKIKRNKLILSLGMGEDRKQKHIGIVLETAKLLKNQRVRTLRIIKENEEYYAIFTVEYKEVQKKPINKIIALDPNHKNVCYGVDNLHEAIEIETPQWLKVFDKRIDELKSKRDRCTRRSKKIEVLDKEGNRTGKEYWEASRRYKKINKTLQEVYRLRREQIKSFLYTTANHLCRNYDLITVGDYTPHGEGLSTSMRRAMNNRSIIGQLKKVLNWVTYKSGKSYMEYKERGTTRTCHSCNYKHEEGIEPNIRYWECPKCKIHHIRDENAAINGLRKIINEFEKVQKTVPSSGRVKIKKRWAWSVYPSGVKTTLRGMNCGKTTSFKKLNKERGSSLPRFVCDQL